MEPGTLGDLRGVEYGVLKGVPETMDVEENAAFLRLRNQLAQLAAHRLDSLDRPLTLSNRRERETFRVGRRQSHARDAECAAVGAVPGLGAAAADRPAGRGREHGRVRSDPGAVELHSLAGAQARAAAQRQCAAGHAERAQERTSRYACCPLPDRPLPDHATPTSARSRAVSVAPCLAPEQGNNTA